MPRRRRHLLSIVAAGAAVAVAAAGLQPGAAQAGKPPKPTKVVIIVVDALSKEIVDKYDMANVQGLMADYVDTPKGYLGHTGSVTVVTHNVITSGLLPKHTGWTTEGYRDVDNILPDLKVGNPGDNLFISSNWDDTSMFPVMNYYGYPKLADYLNQTGVVATISPKVYAAYAFGGPGSDIIVRFGGTVTCPDGLRYRFPLGTNVPSYISSECGSKYLVPRDKIFDTGKLPASLYPAVDARYVVGHDPAHQGGDVWATNAALDVMANEDWSGIFVTLPGVDKAAHMWGGVNDPGPTGADGDAMTHMQFAADTADDQVGRIMDALEASGDLDDTLVVLTADHGSVGTTYAADGSFPGDHFHGAANPALDHGLKNWYYGNVENDSYLDPQPALKPLTDTGNVGLSYSDSSHQRLAHRPVSGQEGRGCRAHGRHARRHRGVAQRRRPLHAGVAGPLRPDDDQGRAPVVRQARPGAGRHPGGAVRSRPGRHPAGQHDVLRRRRPRRHPARGAADPDRVRRRRAVRQGREGARAVGRHHADDPQGDGHHADRRHGRGRLPAAAGDDALAGRLPKGARLGLAGA